MTPYVIDQKKRQEYFLFLIFFTVMSFALGYFFGYQSGQSDPQTNTSQFSEVEQSIKAAEGKDTLPGKASIINEKANVQAVKSEKETKDNKKVSVKTTKEKPKTKPKAKSTLATKQKKTVDKKSTNLKSASAKKPTTKKSDNKKAEPVKVLKPAVVDAKGLASKTESKKPVLDNAKQILKQNTGSVVAADKAEQQDDNKILKSYSVQVGMFASKPNAEKFVDELKENNFNVYLGDFISSTGQTKYNVRLGPYEQRTLAKDNMALYKESYSTPAYIVINK